MTTHTTGTQQLVRRYVAVWSEPDAELRRSSIADLWTQDGVEFVEGTQFRGQDGLDARVTEAYKQFVESGDYTVSRPWSGRSRIGVRGRPSRLW